MAKDNFVKTTDEGKVLQLNTFKLKLPGYAVALGVSPAQVLQAAQDADLFAFAVGMRNVYKLKVEEVTSFKNILRDGPIGTPTGPIPAAPGFGVLPPLVPEGIIKRFRALANFIKAAPAYSDSIGQDLGIVGNEQAFNPEDLKPVITGNLDAGRPEVKWTKGFADSIDIFVERTPGAGFIFLANDTQPDYIDTTPLPDGVNSAVWKYKAIYKIGDEQVGMYSEIISITVTRNTGV